MDYVRLFFEWLYESFGAQHPRLSFLGVFVFAGLIGCFVWWMVGYKYKKDHQHVGVDISISPKPTPASAPDEVSSAKSSIHTEQVRKPATANGEPRPQHDSVSSLAYETSRSVPGPLRKPMAQQIAIVRGLLQQLDSQGHDDIWLSQLFLAMRGGLDGLPSPGDVDYAAALRAMEAAGEIKIIEIADRQTRDSWGGEIYNQDIHLRILKLKAGE